MSTQVSEGGSPWQSGQQVQRSCDLKFEARVAGRGDLRLRGWVGARAYQGGLWL